jgi:type III secretion protein L
MAGLIKMAQAAAAPIRSLPSGPKPVPAVPPELLQIEALRAQIDTLLETLGEREGEIARHAKAIEDAFLAGEAAGRQAGLQMAEERSDEALAMLGQGVEAAVSQLASELAALERLAGLLAIEGLAKVLGGELGYADLIRATLAHHMGQLETASVLRVEVSPVDFPEAGDLARLAGGIGAPGLEIIGNPDLGAGGCRIKLRLGAVEIGVDQQWAGLRALLDETARPEREG